MLNITEDYINSLAPNANAVKNGQGLVKKNSFVKLYKDKEQEETIIFAECKGSGSSNYSCSADFIKSDSPVFRCTCPSRQFPCKHCIGLMFAYLNKKNFEVKEVPEDIKQKREKAQKREENKNLSAASAVNADNSAGAALDGTDSEGINSNGTSAGTKKAKTTNKAAQIKKFKLQIEGLNLLEKLTNDIIKAGLGSFNAKAVKVAEEQAKQFKDFYLTEVQNLFREFINLFKDNDNVDEKVYGEAIMKLTGLNNIAVKGREYLNKRIEDSDYIDSESRMEELVGHTWQISELRDLGRVENNKELIQLSFNSTANDARKEFVDCGIWLDIESGKIYRNLNYRPFKALKYVKEDDSLFSIAKVKELFIYPGGMNNRIKWESVELKEPQKDDYIKIKSKGKSSFKEIIKEVRNEIKNPLSEKEPFALLKFSKIGIVEDDYVLEDTEGNRLVVDKGSNRKINLLKFLDTAALQNQAALVCFRYDLNETNLKIDLLSIITDDEIIRLFY